MKVVRCDGRGKTDMVMCEGPGGWFLDYISMLKKCTGGAV